MCGCTKDKMGLPGLGPGFPLLCALCLLPSKHRWSTSTWLAEAAAPTDHQGKRPHIIFVLADDLGWNDVGYQNRGEEKTIVTPHIDELSAQGVRLDHYYVQSVCTPTRSVLLTGKYQIHTGLQHSIIQSGHPRALGTEHVLIPEKLKTLGYHTHMVGKWHLGYYRREFTPPHRGFDTFFGYWNGAENYYSKTGRCEFPGWECEGPTGCWGYDFFDGDEPYNPQDHDLPEYSTDMLTSRAIDLIKAHNTTVDEPLFLYLSYQAVHGPLEAPEYMVDRFAHVQDRSRRVYAAMVAKLDEGLGNVTQALRDAGLYDDSVIVFSTDNGGDIHFGASNWPLRGWKGSFWEGGIRGAAFVHSPLLQETGVTRHGLMHVADWFPTFVRLAGGQLKEGEASDGVDQWDMLSHGGPSGRSEILHIIDPIGLELDPIGGTKQSALRVGAYKLLVGAPGQWYGHDGWIPPPGLNASHDQQAVHPEGGQGGEEGDYELLPPSGGSGGAAAVKLGAPMHCAECHFTPDNLTTGICLFNIELDPLETCNLAPSRQDLVSRLLQRLSEYNATAVEATYPAPSDKCDPALYGNRFVNWGEATNSL